MIAMNLAWVLLVWLSGYGIGRWCHTRRLHEFTNCHIHDSGNITVEGVGYREPYETFYVGVNGQRIKVVVHSVRVDYDVDYGKADGRAWPTWTAHSLDRLPV